MRFTDSCLPAFTFWLFLQFVIHPLAACSFSFRLTPERFSTSVGRDNVGPPRLPAPTSGGTLSAPYSQPCNLSYLRALCQRAGGFWQIWASRFDNPRLRRTRHASEVCECRRGSQTAAEGLPLSFFSFFLGARRETEPRGGRENTHWASSSFCFFFSSSFSPLTHTGANRLSA